MADLADMAQIQNDLRMEMFLNQRQAEKPAYHKDECEECGGQIEEGRRKAVPHSRLCVGCAREQELKARR